MAFDFKREYRELYAGSAGPKLVRVPPTNYIALRGKGDPNTPGGAYQQAVGVLYAVAYTLKMSHKTDHKILGFFEYVVPPLEGFWRQEGPGPIDYARKDDFSWISVIRLPDFVTGEDVAWAVQTALRKKGLDCSAAELLRVDEGLCVQCTHLGPYDAEPASVEAMDRFLAENGYVNDFGGHRLHHEIYLSDPRRTSPEKLKTILRHPVKKLGETP